ncbi:hypothetical protein [Candidatus Palauibacter sp.]|uniref:hypothetical protein n=1 Tax=Candidatus Palauibacter sp. TaxID=3101350 RepID=UPI003B5296BE
MKLIRRVAAAFTLWALAIGAWAAVSHLTSLPGPAQASTATLDRVATALERADPPGALGAPQRLAASQLRRTAHTAGRINGRIERAVGAWVDRLGHGDAHGQHVQSESAPMTIKQAIHVTPSAGPRVTITVDARSARLGELYALGVASRSPSAAPHGGLWIDQIEKAPAGSAEADIRLRAARHGETWSLRAAEAGSALDAAAIRLDVDANLDRKKLRERIEKLLDLLEDLNNFEGGR